MELPVSALMAGITAAMVGGLITTFFRSGNVSINGPSPALIGIVIAAMSTLGSWEFVLAAFVCSGILQFLFGIFKLGKLADFIPSSVVQGMMAAIGVIILASQVHTGLGVSFKGETDFDNLLAIPQSIINMNPLIAIIFFNSLVILGWHPYIKNKFVKYVPAPIWILVLSIPLYMLFYYLTDGQTKLLGNTYSLVREVDLITLPENIFSGFLVAPNFAKIGSFGFWMVVLSVFLVSTIETLGSAKAVDKMDPLKRKTNLNLDVTAMGVSTIISGFIGGLPIIAVIARSSVNINHGARTRLANFVHGALILLFVFLLSPYIQLVPKAALMAILVYTGYKLASPKVFKDASLKGYEQFMILAVTLLATLITDLNKGILIGIVFTIIIHLIRSHLPAKLFFKYIAKPFFHIAKIDDHFHIRLKGVANFTNVLKLRSMLKQIPENHQVIFDFSHTRLVDFSMLEFVNDWGKEYKEVKNGRYEILGLDEHLTTSEHPFSIHTLPQMISKPLSKRQKEIKDYSFSHGYKFAPEIKWQVEYLKVNIFFDTRPIEYTKNKLSGQYANRVEWEILDITFDEGALMAAEVHNTTMLRIKLPNNIPNFELDKDRFFSRLLDLAIKEDVFFDNTDEFGHDVSIKGKDKEGIKALFKKDLQQFIVNNNKYHIESSSNEMLVFRYFRLMSIEEIKELLEFGEQLINQIQKSLAIPAVAP
jgi:carbonic anhydrase